MIFIFYLPTFQCNILIVYDQGGNEQYLFDKNSITELNYEEYSNDLIHNKKEEEKTEGPRKIKRKRFTTICDQGSGTQDKNEEQYQQENIRQKEIKIQKKRNENKNADLIIN